MAGVTAKAGGFGALRVCGAVSALLLLVLGGCAQNGSEPSPLAESATSPTIDLPSPPPPGQGRIYFYRSDLPLMVALAPEVIVNGRQIGEAAYEAVFYRDALPGRYEVFLASSPEEPIYFSLAAGDLRFVKTVVDIGLTGTSLTAELVEEAKARREIEAQRWAQSKPPAGPRDPS